MAPLKKRSQTSGFESLMHENAKIKEISTNAETSLSFKHLFTALFHIAVEGILGDAKILTDLGA